MNGAQFSRTTVALMYHALDTTSGPGVDPHYSVDKKRFEDQISLCKGLGGGVVNTQQWLGGARGVIFTFDDGHVSNYHVGFPMLKAAGGSGDFFVNPAQVGTPGFATWAQLREMSDGGMSIQSHGYDHRYFLTELSPFHLREDLRRSKQEIEQHIGKPVTLLAPPGGRSPERLEHVARECGYTHVLDSRPGRIEGVEARTLSRLAVTSQLALPALDAWLQGRGTAILRLRYTVLDAAKRAFGDDTYQNIRNRLLRNPGV